MISTGGTIIEAIGALRRAGARAGIYVAATHGLLVGGAPALLQDEALAEVVVTDTVAREQTLPRVRVVSIATLIASAIRRVMADGR